ncbi:MAG: hypothetical protein CMJ46_10175 [Planctomyces sp.]|nr:hypothetical protein [Planctomyces sp.]
MKQSDLIREIARRTGESACTISSRGFNLLSMDIPQADEDRAPLVVDWDIAQASRHIPPGLYTPLIPEIY